MEDRLAQRRLFLSLCVDRTRGLFFFWRCTGHCSGVQLPAGALWLRKVQTNSHLQSGPKVRNTNICEL